ncbi:MAG TPA: hypothetical protein VFU23_10120, partial [Gemmatimonadales bacterium]|nr:hypothetical protein [Gemmatimonadales bacterium]
MKSKLLKILCAGGLAVVAAGCGNAGSDLGLNPPATNAITAQVYLDRDGSHTPTPADTLFPGARVSLRPLGGGTAIQTVTSLVGGVARFNGVPLGEYTITVDQASIGDSISVAAIDSSHVKVALADTNTIVLVRLGFPEVSIRQARLLPIGRRVFIRGVILAGVQSFRDTTSYIADTSGQIRLTRVSLRSGTGNNPGDSVSVLGVSSSRAGQPTLDNALISKFGQRTPPVPLAISTATAANASGGLLDAGLVIITGAIISDTSTIAPDFRVVGSDNSGPVTVILDATTNFNRANFRLGHAMNVRGVLV